MKVERKSSVPLKATLLESPAVRLKIQVVPEFIATRTKHVLRAADLRTNVQTVSKYASRAKDYDVLPNDQQCRPLASSERTHQLKWSLDQLPQRPQLHDYDNAKEPAGRVVSQFEFWRNRLGAGSYVLKCKQPDSRSGVC